MEEPKIINGGLSIDDRGEIEFLNEIPPQFKRMYTVSNFQTPFIRCWHGHRLEKKIVKVLSGAALICVAALDELIEHQTTKPITFYTTTGFDFFKDDYTDFPKSLKKFVLKENDGKFLLIPGGFVNGAKTLIKETKLLYMSDKSIEESKEDDYRFPITLFRDSWRIEER